MHILPDMSKPCDTMLNIEVNRDTSSISHLQEVVLCQPTFYYCGHIIVDTLNSYNTTSPQTMTPKYAKTVGFIALYVN